MSPGKRTIVFSVSGIIELKSLIVIEQPFLSIAGQTAPGNGITLKNCGLYIKTHDVIIRHVRIRPGDDTGGHRFADRDALTIGQDAYNVMIDHVSASWAVDELISTCYEPQYISIQWCLIAEALSKSKHPEGEHSKGVLVGDNTRKISIHHNAFAHINDRAPVQVKGGSSCDVVSNLIYDWGEYAFSFAINYIQVGVEVNFIGNHFKKGPSTSGSFFAEPHIFLDSKLYCKDNTGDDELLLDFNLHQKSWLESKPYLTSSPVDWENNIAITAISTEWNYLLSGVGATLPLRDTIDQRIVNDIKNAEGSIIDSQDDVGGYPNWTALLMTTVELDNYDSDRDGMPNDWELTNDLNPYNSADRNGDNDCDGYTNLEEFLESID